MRLPRIRTSCRRLFPLLLMGWLSSDLSAQQLETIIQPWLEAITENLDAGEEFDFTELIEMVENWTVHPLSLNGPDAYRLLEWNIITPNAYQALQDHIRRHGPLLSLLELQAVPGFTVDQIRLLQSITTVGSRDMLGLSTPLGQQFLRGRREVYLRAGRTIQQARGYEGELPAYTGSPDKAYLRFRHRHGTSLSYGITLEKDAGERLTRPDSRFPLTDFYSAHISLQGYRPWLEAVMLGDFTVSLGQGLILHSGFGAGKGALATSVKRTGQALRPYTSVEENNFMRGAAVTLRPGADLRLTLFASQLRRDANRLTDTLFDNEQIIGITSSITSLQTSGLHRTSAELADQDAVRHTQWGMSLAYTRRRSAIRFNALHSQLSDPLFRTTQLYNQFYFNGTRLTQASIDYGFFAGSLHFFGESAMSGNGAMAHLHGLLAALDRRMHLAVLFRSYDRDYYALNPNAFGESSLANNERGLYTGLQITPDPRWRLDVYHDVWKHPWLRFNVDSPTEGREYFGRVTFTLKRRLEIYGQFRSRQNNINTRPTGEAIAEVTRQIREQARIHINNMLDKSVQLRTRVEWTQYRKGTDRSEGLLIYQDLLLHPVSSPWTFHARIALFDTDDFNARVYAFENDLIYYYAIPAFSDTGSRYYLHVRYKGIRNLTLELKVAETRYRDRLSIGTGQETIEGNRRSEIRAQMIYRVD